MEENPYQAPASPERPRLSRGRDRSVGSLFALAVAIVVAACVGALTLAGK